MEDFLFNIRKGHCSRYATGLALMLRTLGVPTRIVLGFRGMEEAGDGIYEVRQCHAHAWVEALIQRERNGGVSWHWLRLDPTPTTEDIEATEFQWGNWWVVARNGITQFFQHFIIEYDADQQDRAYSVLGELRRGSLWLPVRNTFLGPEGDDWSRATRIGVAGLVILCGGIWLVRRHRARSVPLADPSTAFYRRALHVIARRLGLRPVGGQTPREFAAAAGVRLRASPATRDLSTIPSEAARLYYRVRYGARSLDPQERQTLDSRLDRLDKGLAHASLPAG